MAVSILRNAVFDQNNAFSFDGSFPDKCEESSVPQRMKYFFRQLLTGPKSSPEQEIQGIISVCQIDMLNTTSISANFHCEPPFAVFLVLKLHSQTRSKRLVELLHEYGLSVPYKKRLTIQVNFAQAIADHTRKNGHIVCPSNLRHDIFIVAALDNLNHNPTSRTAFSSFHESGINFNSSVTFITEAWAESRLSTNRVIQNNYRQHWSIMGDLLHGSGWASEDRSSSHSFSDSIQCNEN